MSDPILSREEVDKLADCCFVHSNQLTPHQWRSYAERIEAAVLEKVCGEPVAWQYRPIVNGKPYPWIECTKEAAERLRADDYRETHEVRALYALTRSKP
ncbi:hypothetical protein [Burkholderia multivorans]|uniref:hypothetical protein n=1 Tax=Burkholderia multivorans TaxID=87883 RepID=UPI000D00F984|nr:hypothetical protein [Burkholderia multivorans]PRH33165.1 hypothetical protein C6T53_01885 [Burkholderia multivorans]